MKAFSLKKRVKLENRYWLLKHMAGMSRETGRLHIFQDGPPSTRYKRKSCRSNSILNQGPGSRERTGLTWALRTAHPTSSRPPPGAHKPRSRPTCAKPLPFLLNYFKVIEGQGQRELLAAKGSRSQGNERLPWGRAPGERISSSVGVRETRARFGSGLQIRRQNCTDAEFPDLDYRTGVVQEECPCS